MTTSVRSALNLVGKTASIRQLAQQRNIPIPLSIRKMVGAPPPGKLYRKTIPIELLQRKFDQLFNNRLRPLVKVNLDGETLGQSILTVFFDDSVKGYDAVISQPLAAPGEVLEFPGKFFGTHKFRFSDVNSSGISIHVIPGSPVSLQARVDFENEGVELRTDLANVDFVEFFLEMKMEFSGKDGALDLFGYLDEIDNLVESAQITISGLPSNNSVSVKLGVDFREKNFLAVGLVPILDLKQNKFDNVKNDLRSQLIKEFINTGVDVNVKLLSDGMVAEKIESTVNNKIFDGLKNKEKVRDPLRKYLARIFLGGDFFVAGVTSDSKALYVDYVVPPGQLEPFPEAIQPKMDPGLLANIDHIVVLTMENRSFDHMLGYLRKEGGRLDIDGLALPSDPRKDSNRYPLPNAAGVTKDYFSFPLTSTSFKVSPNHNYKSDGGVMEQLNVLGAERKPGLPFPPMDGFVQNFAPRAKAASVKPEDIMGYYQAKHVPVFDALAKEFLICQRWFCSHPGPTMPNRFYSLTGRLNRQSNGQWEVENPSSSDFSPVSTRTIFDHLTEQSVSWRYYEFGPISSIRVFEKYTFDINNIIDAHDPAKGFFAATSTGTLPAVSFIDPVFVDHPTSNDPPNDDHPPADIANGQRLISDIVRALMNGPKWNKTLLVITYDEHGGFYDHVPPPNAPAVSGIDIYGPRVPAFIISPWVDKGKVSNVVFDHTSILKTISRRFMNANPPDLGERVTKANDLSDVLRKTARTDKPNIPIPPTKPSPQGALVGALAKKSPPSAVEDDRDFHVLMRVLQERRAKQK